MFSAIVPGLSPMPRVFIPEGTFQMGSTRFEDAQPVTEVTQSAFERSETKVTVEQYDEYLRAIGNHRITLAATDSLLGITFIVGRGRTENEVMDRHMASLSARATMSRGGIVEMSGLTLFEVSTPKIPKEFRKFPDQPAIMANWWEMAAFAAAHGGRLPTEAQCERVMRGRSGRDEYGTSTGELTAADGTKLVHYGTDRIARVTARVRSYPPNSFGVFDACGNIGDWTDTWYQDSYEGLQAGDPRGPKEGKFRVVRGGSYFDGEEKVHAAYRKFDYPNEPNPYIGGVVVWPARQ